MKPVAGNPTPIVVTGRHGSASIARRTNSATPVAFIVRIKLPLIDRLNDLRFGRSFQRLANTQTAVLRIVIDNENAQRWL